MVVSQGYTASLLNNLGASSLAGIDVLWVLNGSNGGHSAQLSGNAAAVNAFVSSGGVFVYHDRTVTNAASVLPGGAGIGFVRSTSSEANTVAGSELLSGPGGVITNTTLDGGSSSSHGYALANTLKAGTHQHLTQANGSFVTDFDFQWGLGDVYYSSIPLDYYLGGSGLATFRTVYAPNMASYAAELSVENRLPKTVPEPASMALVSLGLAGVALARRRMSVV